MKDKFKDNSKKALPKIVTAIVMAGSIIVAGDSNNAYAEYDNNSNEIDSYVDNNNSIIDVETASEMHNDGWVKENGKWYYYKNNTKCTGWIKDNGYWYWMKSDGVMASNEWVKVDGYWYWLKQYGDMADNEWVKVDGYWYWLKQYGDMANNEWVKDKGHWYWLKQYGDMADNEWTKISSTWYWSKNNGVMAESEILKVNGTWYRFEASGKMSEKTNLSVGQIKNCDYLNLRSSASTSGSIVGTMYNNEYIEILEKNNNGWFKVQTGKNTIGWASGKYITLLTQGNINHDTGVSSNSKVEKVINIAKQQLGKPYGWGAEGPNSFDCSGLVYYSYKNGAGITLPRTSRTQATAGRQVSKNDLELGDLVFFNTNGEGISHVGIYIGNGNMIHSTKPGDVVKVSSINSSYYASRYVTARRIIG